MPILTQTPPLNANTPQVYISVQESLTMLYSTNGTILHGEILGKVRAFDGSRQGVGE